MLDVEWILVKWRWRFKFMLVPWNRAVSRWPTAPCCLVPGRRTGLKQEIKQEFGKQENARKREKARCKVDWGQGQTFSRRRYRQDSSKTVSGTDHRLRVSRQNRGRCRKDHAARWSHIPIVSRFPFRLSPAESGRARRREMSNKLKW